MRAIINFNVPYKNLSTRRWSAGLSRHKIEGLTEPEADQTYIDNDQLRRIFEIAGFDPEEYEVLEQELLDGTETRASNDRESKEGLLATQSGLRKLTGEELDKRFREHADTLLERLPEHTVDQKRRKERAKKTAMYVSLLPRSNSEFVVSREVGGIIKVRVFNEKMEALQSACGELITQLESRYNAHTASKKLNVTGEIEVYEHNLDNSTIRGLLIKSKWRALPSYAGREIKVAFVTLVLTILLSILAWYGIPEDPDWKGHQDRFLTAVLTTFIVTAVGILDTYFRLVPLIKWEWKNEPV